MTTIFLLGFMGSGKSTLAAQLALKLGYRFIDLDCFIEEKMQQSIASIFEEKGEEAFRKIEREALKEVLQQQRQVVALGGGTPCYFDNMEQINQIGISLFIDVSVAALVKRLGGSTQKRPLLEGKTKEELTRYVQNLLEKRMPFYQKATFRISSDNIRVSDLLALLGNA